MALRPTFSPYEIDPRPFNMFFVNYMKMQNEIMAFIVLVFCCIILSWHLRPLKPDRRAGTDPKNFLQLSVKNHPTMSMPAIVFRVAT